MEIKEYNNEKPLSIKSRVLAHSYKDALLSKNKPCKLMSCRALFVSAEFFRS